MFYWFPKLLKLQYYDFMGFKVGEGMGFKVGEGLFKNLVSCNTIWDHSLRGLNILFFRKERKKVLNKTFNTN